MEQEQILLDKINANIDSKIADVDKKINQNIEKSLKTVSEQIKNYDDSDLNKKIENLNGIIEKQGEALKEFQTKQAQSKVILKDLSVEEKTATLVDAFIESDIFQAYAKKGMHGTSDKFELTDEAISKKTVSLTSDYTGTIFITKPSTNVIDTPNRALNVRQLLPIVDTDSPNIAGQEVIGWADQYTGSVAMLSENADAIEGSFDVIENTWGIKRMAAFYDLSKRVLKTNGLKWLKTHVINVLPKKLKFVEDWQLLYGDGAGTNIKGITIDATSIDLSGNTYSAGAVTSVATYKSGTKTIVTFAAAHDLRNGDSVTFANATAPSYNATHNSILVISAKQIIINLTYVAEANTSAWTGTSKNPFYQAIDNAQEYDCLRVAAAVMSYKDRMINGFVINPVDGAKIDLLKTTAAEYVGITRENGILKVMGIPCIETTAVTAGTFICGDWSAENVELAEFTKMSIQITDDVSYVKANKVCFVIEEEVIFPIYNKLAFGVGNFTTLKAQLEKP